MLVAVVLVARTRLTCSGRIVPAVNPLNTTVVPVTVSKLMLPAPPMYKALAVKAKSVESLGVTDAASTAGAVSSALIGLVIGDAID